jgi:hypothetical protein
MFETLVPTSPEVQIITPYLLLRWENLIARYNLQ